MILKRSRIGGIVPAIVAAALVLAACGGAGGEDGASDAADDETVDDETVDDETFDGPAVSLTLGHPFPATEAIPSRALEPFADEVREATGGTVDIEFHPGGALAPGPAVYESVVSGAQDIGFSLQGFTPGRFPLAQVVELPFMFPDATAEEITEALWDLYDEFPEFQEEYEDVKVLALFVHQPGYLWTRGEKVESLEDLSGLTIRAPGPSSNDLIQELGAAAVGMPAFELYDSLERGVIDGLMIGHVGAIDFDLLEVLDFGVDCDCYTSPFFVAMNLQAWEALSPEQQEVIDEQAGRELSLRAARAYDERGVEVMGEVTDVIDITELPDEELERWREAGQNAIDKWIEEQEAEGRPGQAMYDRLVDRFVEGS